VSEIRDLPRLTRLARAFVYAASAAAFAWPLGLPSTAFSAALFAFVGAGFVARRLARSRLRLPWLLAGGAGAALLCHQLVGWLGGSALLAHALGDATFLALRDALDFGLLALCASITLAAISQRVRWFAFVEVALFGMIASQLVSEHRHGAINRPFEIADPILSAGGDPTFVFYALGGVAALLLAVVLVLERKWWRLLLHLAVLGLLLLGLGFGVSSGVLPTPEPAGDGLGLKGKPKEDKSQNSKGGGRGKARPDNDMLEFRDQEQNRDQQTPVAVVLLHDDYSPPHGMYYFRQGAFSQFNGRRLVTATRDKLDRDIVSAFPVDKVDVSDAPEPGADRATIETTVALLADHTRPFGLEAPVTFMAALNPNPERFRRVYRVVSSALTADIMSLLGKSAGNPAWSAEDRAQYLALPADARYAELAHKLIGGLPTELADDPMLKAWAITRWLSKEVIYSLRSKHASAEDPTADFLFGDKTGYCVHFAHAAAYLLRAAVVPASVASGYAVDEAGRQGGSAILIPSGAAHAWPEVYLDGVGWVVADVHPERTLDPAPEPPDADLQRLLGQLARGVRPLPPDSGEPGQYWKDWARELARLLGRSLGGIAALALVALYLGKFWRWASPRLSRAEEFSRLAYRAELDRLSELGLVRRHGESREAFAARVRAELPSFGPLTELHVGARFGSQLAKTKPRGELEAIVQGLRRERRQAFGPWKRLWALLSPVGWLRAR
jgi:transglutaminase-like putative cysteine protease